MWSVLFFFGVYLMFLCLDKTPTYLDWPMRWSVFNFFVPFLVTFFSYIIVMN